MYIDLLKRMTYELEHDSDKTNTIQWYIGGLNHKIRCNEGLSELRRTRGMQLTD